jgi:hypothetical protein
VLATAGSGIRILCLLGHSLQTRLPLGQARNVLAISDASYLDECCPPGSWAFGSTRSFTSPDAVRKSTEHPSSTLPVKGGFLPQKPLENHRVFPKKADDEWSLKRRKAPFARAHVH